MYLKQLTILNFKNYSTAEVLFDEKVNCLIGLNGTGKSNMLDAIYYLAFSKSFFNPADTQNIYNDEVYFSIHGLFSGENIKEKINCSIKKGHKKIVGRNGKNYERFADHIGLIPLVMISPIDILLLVEGSEGRRKWLDGLISQFDKSYLEHLIAYNKALFQRNALLKNMRNRSGDISLLVLWDEHLISHGQIIYEKRCTLMHELTDYFNEYYRYISESKESVSINYTSHLFSDSPFANQLQHSVQNDLQLRFTSIGIHKDDIEFLIDGRPVKKFASQGQQKSVLLALRLAQARLISVKKKMKPLMLLDDIYDKLDARRMAKLLDLLNTEDFGQLFITDTNMAHMNELLGSCGMEGKFFHVNNGEVISVELMEVKT